MSALRVGAEDRKKLIAAGVFGVLALGSLVYTLSDTSGGPAALPAAAPIAARPAGAANTAAPLPAATPRGLPARLDPTLHPEGMLLTESLVYAGNGRNIFLAGSAAAAARPVVVIPRPVATPRYLPPPVQVATGPPPPPPIDLRFFGTATRKDGTRQAFLLRGEDVFVAGTGDIVSRRYKVGAITSTTVEVTDMTTNNTQRLPMSMQ